MRVFLASLRAVACRAEVVIFRYQPRRGAAHSDTPWCVCRAMTCAPPLRCCCAALCSAGHVGGSAEKGRNDLDEVAETFDAHLIEYDFDAVSAQVQQPRRQES